MLRSVLKSASKHSHGKQAVTVVPLIGNEFCCLKSLQMLRSLLKSAKHSHGKLKHKMCDPIGICATKSKSDQSALIYVVKLHASHGSPPTRHVVAQSTQIWARKPCVLWSDVKSAGISLLFYWSTFKNMQGFLTPICVDCAPCIFRLNLFFPKRR